MKNIKKLIHTLNKDKLFIITSFVTICYMLFISFILYKHATTFNFVDEYTNIVAGFFMNRGRELYTQIFVNHQPLMAFISSWLQMISKPDSLYEVIRDHRLIVILFAFLSNIFLILRFRYIAIGFIVFFETLKYYLFGNVFLAESFIVYPFIYMLGIIYENFSDKHKITLGNTLLSALITWFILAMREPFIPVALLLYGVILLRNKTKKHILYSLVLFISITLFSLLFINIKEYIYQVFIINMKYMIPYEMALKKTDFALPIAFLYPFSIFFDKSWNFYRVILLLLNCAFIFMFIYLLIKSKKKLFLLIMFLTLGLANIRWIPSDIIFYGAFHQIVWFGLFLYSLFFMLKNIKIFNKKIFFSISFYILLIFLGMITYPKSYLWEKVDRVESFTTNYARFYTAGKIINTLASPKDKVFVYDWESLVYFEAKKDSAYPYVMYYPIMMAVPEYIQAKNTMFKDNPPAFYFYDKGKAKDTEIPSYRKQHYYVIQFQNKPIGLYISKDKIKTLSQEQKNMLDEQKFKLEKNTN